jgi:hypothetical protein
MPAPVGEVDRIALYRWSSRDISGSRIDTFELELRDVLWRDGMFGEAAVSVVGIAAPILPGERISIET